MLVGGGERRGKGASVDSTVDVSERRVASFGQKTSLMTTCINTTMRSFKLNTDRPGGSDVSSEWTSTAYFLTPPRDRKNKRGHKQLGGELNMANLTCGGGAHSTRCCTGRDQMGADRHSLVFRRGNAED